MSSSNATSTTPSGKRPRIDPNRTPRANLQLSVSGSSDANSAASSSGYDIDYDETESMASKRTRSNKPSPRKTTHTLAYLHVEHVIQYKAFDGRESASAPASLKELVASIEADAFGQGIISDHDLALLGSDALGDPLFSSVFASSRFVDRTGVRAQLGASLSKEVVCEILDEAEECEEMRHSEANWNCFVHSRLIRLALRLSSVNSDNHQDASRIRIGCLNATTAQISKPFAPHTFGRKHDKRIDFCFYIDLPDSNPASHTLNQVCHQTLHGSINHTDYAPLLRRPVCLSIETKRTGEDWQAALEQTSIWLAAQWACLDKLVGTPAVATGLDFLPALIVQGHDWFFVSTTRNRRPDWRYETILWSKVVVGSTASARGLYQVVTTIQRLAKWCSETYWPWFATQVLGHGVETGS
ncbi:hypothetical protein CDV36_015336 [Fusarium kuroshium]|uniref:PD-(D/E)XK nuclease-like domain-containing protein n=2 Tax=Fusarium solani species complex TaxID=232080 RepID=A0A3M2RAU6_9HYPO|nr:hypothetical protein CDV36_015336 [Fusarium kuroshium]RSL53052.1 hypothetical protein CEP51_014959 [Fusarium floridanum]